MIRRALLWGSRSSWLRHHAMRHGFVRRSVERFMPGEDVASALDAAMDLASRRIAVLLTCLGENVTTADEAEAVVDHYLDVARQAADSGLDSEISVKLTQLGLDLSTELAYGNVRRIAERAAEVGSSVWIDMEDSSYLDRTLEIYRRVRAEFAGTGVCLQSYLYRTADDLDALLPDAPALRLVKGAYAEPPRVAFPSKRDVDENFFALSHKLLRALADGDRVRPAFATHDPDLIRRIELAGRELDLPADVLEFQLLYGIRRDEQDRLARQGHTVRVLISYGDAWFPWFMRRLAERPANLVFVLRQLTTG